MGFLIPLVPLIFNIKWRLKYKRALFRVADSGFPSTGTPDLGSSLYIALPECRGLPGPTKIALHRRVFITPAQLRHLWISVRYASLLGSEKISAFL